MRLTRLQSGHDVLYTLLLHDITERKQIAARLYRETHFNSLTGQPNRASLVEDLNTLIKKGDMFAQVFLDTTNIKRINDSLGFSAGDQCIRILANRLSREMPDGVSLFHLYGGQFAFIVRSETQDALQLVIARIQKCFNEAVNVENEFVFGNFKMGIAFFPADGQCAESLMNAAHSAMNRVKENGAYALHAGHCTIQAQRDLKLESLLRRAIDNDELDLFYQPKVAAETERFVGAEALVRWHSPELGWVSPGEFITLAEQTDLILPIGRQVLNKGVAMIASLIDEGHRNFSIAVNISPKQFVAGDLVQQVEKLLTAYRVPASYLELEVTEGVLIEAADTIREQINQLQALGVHLALDDFGTGYSSLSYLRDYRFDTLKIDQSFVRPLEGKNDDLTLVRAICMIGHAQGMTIVAEGVETAEQVSLLRNEGCDIYQGYHFGKPMPTTELIQWISNNLADQNPGNEPVGSQKPIPLH